VSESRSGDVSRSVKHALNLVTVITCAHIFRRDPFLLRALCCCAIYAKAFLKVYSGDGRAISSEHTIPVASNDFLGCSLLVAARWPKSGSTQRSPHLIWGVDKARATCPGPRQTLLACTYVEVRKYVILQSPAPRRPTIPLLPRRFPVHWVKHQQGVRPRGPHMNA
jgi:hypothetical protein